MCRHGVLLSSNRYEMMRFAFLVLVVTLHVKSGWAVTQPQQSQGLTKIDFVHRAVLDQMGSFVMLWSPYEDEIVIEIQVRTHGYVGLGFSPTGGMKNADIVVGWIDDRGFVQFTDRHASGHRTPVEDESQDYRLMGGYANDSHTVLRFSRPWITCDSASDFALTKDTVRVIWAYDALKPDPTKSTLRFHDHRGTKSLYLKEPRMAQIPPMSQIRSWDIRSPDVELPGDLNTLYWCKLYKIPDLAHKYQVIGYIPLIDEASLPLVHHMLLYECSIPNSDLYLEKWVQQKGAQCYTKNMPTSWTACGAPIVAWAIGSQGEMLPNHVGIPVGEKHGGATYFLLEIHYDNPEYKTNLKDNSGLRMFLTDQLRLYDAGVLTLGHKVEPSLIIPPKRIWPIKSHCTARCTEKTIPEEGINIFSGILHAHLLGTAISVQHIRNGVELEPIIIDKSYDFNYQQARFLQTEKVIKPGDHMITTCVYNATHKSQPTFGGFATDDEMCLAFLTYYPRIKLGECYSRPDLAVLLDVFGIQNLYENDRIMKIFSEEHFDSHDINSNQEDSDWKKMNSESGIAADSFRLVDFFRIINISEPAHLKDRSLYDILTDDRTWKDENLIRRLSQAVTDFQYEPSCHYLGRGLVTGLPKKAKIPHFIEHHPGRDRCTPSFNPDEGILQKIELESSQADNRIANINSVTTKRKQNILENQSALRRNDASANTYPTGLISLAWTLLLLRIVR